MIEVAEVPSPVGVIRVAARHGRLCALDFSDGWHRSLAVLERRFGDSEMRFTDDAGGVVTRVRAYLDGDVDALDGVEVDVEGTPFQLDVWRAIRAVPAGETATYSDIARAVGRPAAVRAVGTATGSNPVAIVVPCHRIVRASGELGNYGGGIERKQWLLVHEAKHAHRR